MHSGKSEQFLDLDEAIRLTAKLLISPLIDTNILRRLPSEPSRQSPKL